MKNKFILLDRDGVINVEKNYLHTIEEFEYEKNVVLGLAKLGDLGYKFSIITNQAGIAKGYYSEEDYFKLQKFIEEDLLKKGIKIEKSYFCPHHPDGIGKYKKNCECRKPNTKNFEIAIKEFKIDTFVMGNDWEGKFDFLKDVCEVVYLPRTKEISTTQIKKDLKE